MFKENKGAIFEVDLTDEELKLFEKLPKIPQYEVWNTKFNESIGFIHWRGGWRQYVFQAKPEVDMSRSCQKEIIDYIDILMEEWRKSHKK